MTEYVTSEARRETVRRSYAKNKERYKATYKKRFESDPEFRETKRQNYRNYVERDHARAALKAIKSGAKKRGLDFSLTKEWYAVEYEKGCAVTGFEFNIRTSGTPWVAHVDRINPKEGYIESNCRLVCGCYNTAKLHWTDEDVLKMAKALIKKSESKGDT